MNAPEETSKHALPHSKRVREESEDSIIPKRYKTTTTENEVGKEVSDSNDSNDTKSNDDWSVHLLDGSVSVLKALFGDDSDD